MSNDERKIVMALDPFAGMGEPVFILKADNRGAVATWGPNISWITAMDLCWRGILILLDSHLKHITKDPNLVIASEIPGGGKKQ